LHGWPYDIHSFAGVTPLLAPRGYRVIVSLYELSPTDARQVLRDVQESVPVQLQPADIDDRVIPGGPTGQVSIRIVRPTGAVGVLPVVFHSHGGWIPGDKDTHERLDRELANQAQAVVVFVDYTPAPDAHYPVQNEQAYTALQWAIANAAQIGADPSRVALVGDSVGGNMTAGGRPLAANRGEHPPQVSGGQYGREMVPIRGRR